MVFHCLLFLLLSANSRSGRLVLVVQEAFLAHLMLVGC